LTERTPSVFEIQAGEGGSDSKLFCEDLGLAYVRYASRNGLSLEGEEWEKGKVSLLFTGHGALRVFLPEAGKHCVQRVPPTEKKGRRQTSIVTVAVTVPASEAVASKLNLNEVQITTKRGSGPGGQHRNKTESCVVARHVPTGLTATIDGRDQHANKRLALRVLAARVQEANSDISQKQSADAKRAQVGTGGRGDKIRTYNFIDCRAVDHRTGVKTGKVDDVIGKGKFELLA
jgi:peptide chain release factor 1